MIRLADYLYRLRNREGYGHFIDTLKCCALEAAFFELEVANMLHKSGREIIFVKRSGIMGSDYDLIADICGARVAVEAKSRRFREISDENALGNALSKAREQLPRPGPGIIAVSVPEVWMAQGGAESRVAEVIQTFLRKTQRVNHVLLHWNTWALSAGKHAATLFVRQYDNPNRRHPFSVSPLIALPSGAIMAPSFW
jgi:Holliday junction resolvase